MHRTETAIVEIARVGARPRMFKVSAAVARKVEILVKKAEESEELIPAEVVSPVLADDKLRPAAMVRGARYREELTQVELAKRLGIRQSHLSEMENAKRPVGKAMAKKLAAVLRCDFRIFL